MRAGALERAPRTARVRDGHGHAVDVDRDCFTRLEEVGRECVDELVVVRQAGLPMFMALATEPPMMRACCSKGRSLTTSE